MFRTGIYREYVPHVLRLQSVILVFFLANHKVIKTLEDDRITVFIATVVLKSLSHNNSPITDKMELKT